MSIRHPFGETDLQTIYAAGGTLEIPISCGTTILETQTLTSNCTINLDVDSDIQVGAEILIKCTTNGTETFTFGTGIDAPTITGVAGKTWSQSFIYNGASFTPDGVHSFTESLCPSITLGALGWSLGNQYFILGQVSSVDALITNGTAPFTPSVTIGSLPTGMNVSSISAFGNNYIRISGTPTTFGSYTFTIGGTDANGCAITPKEYTVNVGLQVTNSTPVPILGEDFAYMLFSVSGLPVSLGTGVILSKFTINGITFPDVSGFAANLREPLDAAGPDLLIPYLLLSGVNLTACEFNTTSALNISSGSAPYTGQWDDAANGLGFTAFNGVDPNGDWAIEIENLSTDTGTIDSCTILFLPI